jgi:hypothetical protein
MSGAVAVSATMTGEHCNHLAAGHRSISFVGGSSWLPGDRKVLSPWFDASRLIRQVCGLAKESRVPTGQRRFILVRPAILAKRFRQVWIFVKSWRRAETFSQNCWRSSCMGPFPAVPRGRTNVVEAHTQPTFRSISSTTWASRSGDSVTSTTSRPVQTVGRDGCLQPITLAARGTGQPATKQNAPNQKIDCPKDRIPAEIFSMKLALKPPQSERCSGSS